MKISYSAKTPALVLTIALFGSPIALAAQSAEAEALQAAIEQFGVSSEQAAAAVVHAKPIIEENRLKAKLAVVPEPKLPAHLLVDLNY